MHLISEEGLMYVYGRIYVGGGLIAMAISVAARKNNVASAFMYGHNGVR